MSSNSPFTCPGSASTDSSPPAIMSLSSSIINAMSMRLVLDAAAALSDMDDPPRAFVSVMPEASAKPSSSPNICLCTWCQSDKRSFKWSSARVMLFTSSSDVFPSATKQPRSIKSTFRPSLSSTSMFAARSVMLLASVAS